MLRQSVLVAACVLVVICQVANAQVPPVYNETCETNKYPPTKDKLVPTFTVNLDLPAELRWVEITLKYKQPLVELIAYIKTFILEFSPKFQKLIDIMDKDAGIIVDTLPQPYAGEIKGIASASGLPLGDVAVYNIFYEIFTLCTSIVGSDPDGKMYHARNLDFGLFLGWDLSNDTWLLSEKLRPLIINVDYKKGGVVQYKTVTFVGFVGLITGVKPGYFSISMNERFEVKGGFIGLFEWIMNINRNQSFVTFLARDTMENPTMDYNGALDVLSNTPLIAPCYYIIAGVEKLQGAVVTKSRDAKPVDVWKLGSNNTWYLAETNYDHWEAPLFIDDRITPCNNCMTKLTQNNLNFAGLFNVLSSKPVLNKLTVYTALMEPKSGLVETWIQYCPTPCWPF